VLGTAPADQWTRPAPRDLLPRRQCLTRQWTVSPVDQVGFEPTKPSLQGMVAARLPDPCRGAHCSTTVLSLPSGYEGIRTPEGVHAMDACGRCRTQLKLDGCRPTPPSFLLSALAEQVL
jgi:hypothetical protein